MMNNLFSWLIAFLVGVVLMGWVTFRILFPVFSFEYGDNLSSDFFMTQYGGEKYWRVILKDGFPFRKFQIKMRVSFDDLAHEKKGKLVGEVYQNELNLFPVKGEIDSWEELLLKLKIGEGMKVMNGELLADNKSVYLITNNQYRAFSNAESFDRLGFDWGKVRKIVGGELVGLSKGENILTRARYLPGTFVSLGDGEFYLLGDNEKIRIEGVDLQNMIAERFGVVKVDKEVLSSVGTVTCEKSIKGDYSCLFVDLDKKVLEGANIFIDWKDDFLVVDGKIKVYTFSEFFDFVPKIVLRNIKRRFLFNYFPEKIQ